MILVDYSKRIPQILFVNHYCLRSTCETCCFRM